MEHDTQDETGRRGGSDHRLHCDIGVGMDGVYFILPCLACHESWTFAFVSFSTLAFFKERDLSKMDMDCGAH
jgi:hypothetical protein